MVAAAIFRQNFLAPGTYRSGGQEVTYSADDLATFARNTNRMLADGIDVPIFPYHKAAGSREGGPRRPDDQIDARDVVGELRGIGQNEDGSLWHELHIRDPECAKGIDQGNIKCTSPELRNYVGTVKGSDGFEEYGQIVRHIALTPKPINKQQGPIVPMAEGAEDMSPQFSQFSMLDKFENSEADKDQPEKDDATLEATVSAVENVQGQQIGQQVLNDLETAGIAAPRGVDPVADPLGFLAQLSASLRQKAIEDTKAAAEEKTDDDLEIREEPGVAQYSEPPESEEDMKAAEQLKQQNEELAKKNAALVAQFAESKRDGLRERIKASKYPTFVADELLSRIEAVQFAEDGTSEQSLRIEDVLELFDRMAEAPNITFAEKDVVEADHPDGDKVFAEGDIPDGHVSAEEAEKIVNDLAAGNYHEPTPKLVPATAE